MTSSPQDGRRRWRRAWSATAATAGLCAALLAVWLTPIFTGTDAGSYEATAIAAVAAITAALLVVVPAVLLVAIQGLSQFSWRTVRVLADRQMATWVVVAAVVGVCVPLGLAVNPSPLTTRIAFTCFIASIVIVAWVTWNSARHATPDWLVHHMAATVLHPRGRGTGQLHQVARRASVLATWSEVHACRFASTGLPR